MNQTIKVHPSDKLSIATETGRLLLISAIIDGIRYVAMTRKRGKNAQRVPEY
jgi:hypothetical protein